MVVSVESHIEQVTVYASGARVRRVTTLASPLPSVVRFVGLPLAVIDETVRIEIDGPAIATAVRTRLDAPTADDAAREESTELRTARRRMALAQLELERIDAALEVVGQSTIIEPDPSDDPPPAWSAVVAARRTVVALRTERELHLRELRVVARREAEVARDLLAAVSDRELRTRTERAPKLHELRKQVELELALGDVPPDAAVEIHLEYQVAAARWAPSYVARLEGEQVRFELRAVVAQDSGEDWLGASLRLSTAEPERFAALPELAAQRIGRRQDEPGRTGFRAPPTGAELLYADYRAAFPASSKRGSSRAITGSEALDDSTYEGRVPPMGAPFDDGSGGLSDEVWDEDSSLSKDAFMTPPRGSPAPPQPMRAPAPMQHAMRARSKKAAYDHGPPMVGGAATEYARSTSLAVPQTIAPGYAPPPPPPAPTPRLDYVSLRMASPTSDERGRLIPMARDPLTGAAEQEVATVVARLAMLMLPRGCVADWAHTYDYAFASDGRVDVRGDGAWHNLALTARTATAKVRHVAVPREQADVFRLAGIPNPFAGPLLPGPIDVYDRGQFLLTSTVDYTPPGATVEIGLGVDATVKVARNSEFREEAAGMLRGALRLVHAITIDVENLSGRAVDVEVRERIPVTREGDDDIEVTLGKVEPAWERWTPDASGPRDRRLRGGHRWRLALPAGAKRTLRAGYEVKIATKHELVGGNRREL